MCPCPSQAIPINCRFGIRRLSLRVVVNVKIRSKIILIEACRSTSQAPHRQLALLSSPVSFSLWASVQLFGFLAPGEGSRLIMTKTGCNLVVDSGPIIVISLAFVVFLSVVLREALLIQNRKAVP